MADYIDITVPVIENVTFTPQAAPVNGQVTISATITEKLLRRMYPMPFYSGEIACGEN